MQIGMRGKNTCQRRLAAARRTPENDRGQAAAIDHFAQGGAGAGDMLLPGHILKALRTQAVCQRARGLFRYVIIGSK
jgi:hypothetical protein